MPQNRVAKHLRELAAVARGLEEQADAPKSTRVMNRLAIDYEALAVRIEKMEVERDELVTHIERCGKLLRATRQPTHKAVLADLLRYLEGRLLETVGGDEA
jgi:hypothetical protein